MPPTFNKSVSSTKPQTVDFPWHKLTWNNFVKALTVDHLPHALLLTGEEGIGKLQLAERMARSLLCMQPIDSEACGKCQSCATYLSGANPDYTKIELLVDKQQISVDQIRSLGEFLNLSRSFNTHRVAIINPIERMNNNAANSLLKSLEEPANNSIIILIASHLCKVLPTIKSRCHLINVASPSHKQALEWMEKNYPDTSQAELRLSIASNKPLKALSISDDDISHRSSFFDDLIGIITEKTSVVTTAKKWEKADLGQLLDWQIIWAQQLIKQTECKSLSGTEDTQQANQKDITIDHLQQSLFTHIKPEKQWALYQRLIKQKQYIHTSVNTLMFIENMLLLWLETTK